MTARPRLVWAAAAALLVLGALAEAVATPVSWPLRVADLAVGAAFALGATRPGLGTSSRLLALAVAATWFVGTLADSGGDHEALVDAGAALVLAYRGPLLHLLLRPPGRWAGWHLAALAAAGYAGAVLPIDLGAIITVFVAFAAAATSLRRAPVALAVGAVWAAAAAGLGDATTLLVANDVALLAVAAAMLWAPESERLRRDALHSLVVDLGRSGYEAGPISRRLAEALGDPALRVVFHVPPLGWIDETGAPVSNPEAVHGPSRMTRSPLPSGSEVALLHAPGALVDPRLAVAAAGAVSVAIDSARIDAEARLQAAAVRASRRRLLEVADLERDALERRVRDGPLERLERVRALLDVDAGHASSELDEEIQETIEEILRLARGLAPGSLAREGLAPALRSIVEGSPVPVELELSGPLERLSPGHAALVYFFVAECLTNTVCHADASRFRGTVRVTADELTVSAADDGGGNARLDRAHGLQGLADRVAVAGGVLTIASPPGAGTEVAACVPLDRP